MRSETRRVLSEYGLGRRSVDELRDFIEDVDWDDPEMPDEERYVFLKVEAFLTGIDEALNTEADLRAYLPKVMVLRVLDFVQHQAGQVASEAGVESASAQQTPYEQRGGDHRTPTWMGEPAVVPR